MLFPVGLLRHLWAEHLMLGQMLHTPLSLNMGVAVVFYDLSASSLKKISCADKQD